ncbi:MAG TPA: hypothetical protein VMZ26_01290 [Pyrinomonadaceae bacterium]|nr:hypothetical protein [Pyrinomonadaceae bacterium]
MKYLSAMFFLLLLSTFAGAQELGKRNFIKPPGSVSGEIFINNLAGNGLDAFTCSNLVVSVGKLGGGWQRKTRATGNFSQRHCMFVVPSVPAGESFVAVLNARMPSCDQKSFETTTSFAMTLKPGEAMEYNFSVSKISCQNVK